MRIVRSGTTARTYLEYGRQMLLAYHRRFHPFTESATLELEEKFLFRFLKDVKFEASSTGWQRRETDRSNS